MASPVGARLGPQNISLVTHGPDLKLQFAEVKCKSIVYYFFNKIDNSFPSVSQIKIFTFNMLWLNQKSRWGVYKDMVFMRMKGRNSIILKKHQCLVNASKLGRKEIPNFLRLQVCRAISSRWAYLPDFQTLYFWFYTFFFAEVLGNIMEISADELVVCGRANVQSCMSVYLVYAR